MIVVIVCLTAIAVSLWDKFYRPLRAGIYSYMGLMDLPRHRKLPAELDREIFLFLNQAAQRKFIWGLNWDFYAMFRYRLLTKVCMKNMHLKYQKKKIGFYIFL
jgi:hypothetical protein